MPVKMIALRPCYVPSSHREFDVNQRFDAVDEREADRLTRKRRARRADEAPAPEPVAAPQPTPEADSETTRAAPRRRNHQEGYRRRDMRAED